MTKEVKDKIDTAAVTVADAIREVEFKLGGKKQIIRKAKTKTQVAETKMSIIRAVCTLVI